LWTNFIYIKNQQYKAGTASGALLEKLSTANLIIFRIKIFLSIGIIILCTRTSYHRAADGNELLYLGAL